MTSFAKRRIPSTLSSRESVEPPYINHGIVCTWVTPTSSSLRKPSASKASEQAATISSQTARLETSNPHASAFGF